MMTTEEQIELDEAWSYVAELTKALTGLTCGGSEFFIRRNGRYIADTKACVDYVFGGETWQIIKGSCS